MENERSDAIRAISSMLARSERAQAKFKQGTSQHTLLKNRMHALRVASALVRNAQGEPEALKEYGAAELEQARAPIASLISKSEKARGRLPAGTWQHTMLSDHLNALYIASQLLTEESG